MSETDGSERRTAWRRALGEAVAAIDLLPDGVAVMLGVLLGAALVGAAAVVGWPGAAVVGVGLAVLVGRSADVRPQTTGWGRPAAGVVGLVGLVGVLASVAFTGISEDDEGEEQPVVVARADEGEAMRLDLGGAGSTSGGESTDESTGDGESTGTVLGSTATDGGDEITGGPPERRPFRPRTPREPESDDTTTSSGATSDDGETGREPEPKCPSDMVLIDGGSFDGHDIEPFCIDLTEVKVSSYERCMRNGQCSEAGRDWGLDESSYVEGNDCNRNHEGRGSHPVNCVDWKQASAFCGWIGKRLPTEWEWEWAARGRDEGRTYPWGEEKPTCDRAVMSQGGKGCGKGRTSNAGSRPKGNSRDGVKDMAGNLWEWTSSKEGERCIVRGGSWIVEEPEYFRASRRGRYLPTSRFHVIGFRCAKTADSAE